MYTSKTVFLCKKKIKTYMRLQITYRFFVSKVVSIILKFLPTHRRNRYTKSWETIKLSLIV